MFPKFPSDDEFGKSFDNAFNKAQNTARIGLYASIGFGIGLLALAAYAIHAFAH